MKNRLLLCAGSCLLAVFTLTAADPEPSLAPQADKVLRAATDFLAKAPQFTVSAEVWRDRVMEAGQKLQFTRTVDLHVRRPNGLHAEVRGALSQRGFWYDGKSLTVLDRKRNLYGSAAVPETLDAALDSARDDFGIDLPLMDLAVSDPYASATANVQKGVYLGLAPVLGVECHHLAFTQDNLDWQIWIENGPQPFIRKLVLTYKNEEQAPQLTAVLTHWDITSPISPADFVFDPPSGTAKIEMKKVAHKPAAPVQQPAK